MAEEPRTLGARIRRARERARLSQEELAKAVDASVRAVGDWENDRRKPRNRMGALEEVLGVSLEGDEKPPPVSPRLRREIYAEFGPEDAARVIAAIEGTLTERAADETAPLKDQSRRAG